MGDKDREKAKARGRWRLIKNKIRSRDRRRIRRRGNARDFLNKREGTEIFGQKRERRRKQ